MKVYLIDDDAAVRDSLSLLIESEGLAVESFASAEEFLAGSEERRGCAVIDLRMQGMDGMRLHQELRARGIRLPAIFLTGYGDIPTSVKAMKAGAIDFLTKPVTGAALLAGIRTALAVAADDSRQAESTRNAVSSLATLTEREREVMRLAVTGLSNKEIARRLAISHRTVEIHKAHVMHKTGAHTLLELVRIAQAAGVEGEAQSPG